MEQRHTWLIRAARPDETAALSEVAETIFRDTFAPFNTDADMDMYCAEAMVPSTFEAVIDDPMSKILVATLDGAIVAYAHLHRGPSPVPPRGAMAIELKRFYLLRAQHGTGLARVLMRAVAEYSAELDAEVLWLGVWEKNGRAIAFYRKLGFEEVGELSFMLGTDLQRDLMMAISVSSLLAAATAGTEGSPR